MKILNKEIPSIVQFLDKVNIKGRKSLGRTKLKKEVTEQFQNFVEDQSAVIDEFDGWINKDEGKYNTANPELNEALSDLLMSEVEITFNSPFKKDFTEAIEMFELGKNFDDGIEGEDADAYEVLYEQLVTNKEGGVIDGK